MKRHTLAAFTLALLLPAYAFANPVYPPDRTAGDVSVFVGAAGYGVEFEEFTPGAEVSTNVHLTPYLAVTARTAVVVRDPVLWLPAVGGARFQFPLGAATIALSPTLGAFVAFGDDEIPSVGPALGMRTSYEFAFESGFSYGFDLGAEFLPSAGWLPGGALKVGWEF